ncbi:PQQ-binding-like beta-propeller repeat protein [Rhodovastum atsumiense]|uniref:PQQ-binding-like beta-propeller repeat protein n=1 Tax=Rhodovastum atsumiense TaxID=504468 RepID=A0A5M6IYU8_9PROT|nr:PQQ-binding-like beta-propeller repeat protein [Rhodovastum atsumiense]KAA5613461.1 PQQ-binding-like beta-propeller repeat protein [Rhodovastum atsumiense]CAH2603197.1 PQQ-binding-like beta-propeller repeat protein [Rhodovastum atsumiense]
MSSRLARTLPWRLALLAATCLAVSLGASAAEPPKAAPDKPAADQPAKPKARPVQVTEEMTGAGIVSSGVELPPPPPVTGTRANPVPSWGKPLPWPIIIADRRNNRLLEVTPDKRIVWEFPSPLLKIYRGNDDVNFSTDGKTLVVNEEDNYDIHFIDYETRRLTWSYGVPDTRGTGEGLLNYPDDARLLPDGRMVVADIRNCRLLFIDPKTSKTLTQWGKPGVCRHDPPNTFVYPNDINYYENGDLLVTEITDAWITRLAPDGHVVWSVRGPHLRYPSDARAASDGNIIVADFVKPGGIVIFNPATKKIVWEYRVTEEGEKMLDHPSLAVELPTGDILVNDDHRERVLVIDRQTKEFIWQYGVTDQRGHAPGYLWYPDSVELDVFHDWKAALAGK